ncbi:uncharacterized protein LOC126858367 [Cataglyphis hispanica]|uniref:uncharacterized protein LOC126858367 n=1 Tax=Cataglyphis hispanica TaxID=1086592 RepID=UPI0021807803|nr:uncharacterized protein LOC126858367 [Cataglyphis hispanica]
MIVEIEEDSRDFATVYKKDYLGRKGERPIASRPLPKYRSPLNILNGPYKQYLNTRLENRSLPENERSEDPSDTLNRIRDKFPHLRNVLPEIVPDENVIEREKKKSITTIFQSDYWRDIKTYRIDVTLPQDCIIPETIQRRAYRDPWVIAPRDFIKRPKIVKPCNNLDPNPKEREILRVITGDSEYINTIGITGERIMLGSPSNMKKRITLQKSLRDPEITESECSLILKQNLALPSKIF